MLKALVKSRGRLILLGLLASLSLLALVFVVFSYRSYRQVFHQLALKNAQVEQNFQRVISEQAKITAHEFFRPASEGQDAGVFLNQRFPFLGTHKPFALTIAKPLLKQLSTAYKSGNYQDLDLSGLDLKWMKDLHDYGYWDLRAHSPHMDQSNPFAPFPAINHLVGYVQARLVTGFQQKNLKPALDEAYHLLRLYYSTNVGVNSAVAASMLKEIHQAYLKGLKLHLLKPQDWHYPAPEQLETIKKLSREMVSILANPLLSEAKIQLLTQHPEWQVGLCSALHESLLIEFLMAPFFSSTWPGELERVGQSTARDRLTEQNLKRCRLQFDQQRLKEARLQKPLYFQSKHLLLDLISWDREQRQERFWRLSGLVPYLRRTAGLQIANALTNSAFEDAQTSSQ